jgi:hypothetical protein|tara:strand:- start:641 stop:1102 length:462 start_codon:yes stop_codon:yes gene_type:complete
MIQIQQQNSSVPLVNYIFLDIYDKMTNIDYKQLFGFTSQLSKKTLYSVTLSSLYTNKERYVEMTIYTLNDTPAPTLGAIRVGTTDYPYGLYDTTIYQNTSDTNVDPTGLPVIWTGLMNLRTNYGYVGSTPNPAVEYEEYNTNDTDTDSVYITF